MLKLRTAYHVTHMLKDLEAATALYQKIFQAPVQFAGYHAGENRDASFASVSDAYIELFAPRDIDQADPPSPGGRFIQRWGEGLANFGWLVDGSMTEAVDFCRSRGYELAGVVGQEASAFFVHPRQAHGIMIEIAGGTIRDDPRAALGWAAHWRDQHPLGIERMNAVTYALRDLDGGIAFLQSLTDAPLIDRRVDQLSGRESAFLWVTDHMIELTRGISENSAISRAVREQGPKIYSVTFRVRSLKQAAEHLRGIGVRVLGPDAAGDITIDPADILGARYVFTERAIANDPRDHRPA